MSSPFSQIPSPSSKKRLFPGGDEPVSNKRPKTPNRKLNFSDSVDSFNLTDDDDLNINGTLEEPESLFDEKEQKLNSSQSFLSIAKKNNNDSFVLKVSDSLKEKSTSFKSPPSPTNSENMFELPKTPKQPPSPFKEKKFLPKPNIISPQMSPCLTQAVATPLNKMVPESPRKSETPENMYSTPPESFEIGQINRFTNSFGVPPASPMKDYYSNSNSIYSPNNSLQVPIEGNVNPYSPEHRGHKRIPSSPQNSVSRSSKITDFEELKMIGKGSFGSVYKCRHKIDGWLYAVKVSNKKLRNSEKQSRLKEVYALAALATHPNIVRYYNSWLEDNFLYIQTEFCCGGSLSSKLGQLNKEPHLCEILKQVATGLEYIHATNFVHLDIKPENIYITLSGDYKIGDFGLITETNNRDFQEGDSRYLPLELLTEDVQWNHVTKADIFSLGASVYELAYGKRLPSNGPEWTELRENAKNLQLPSTFSPLFVSLLRSMLHRNPEERPSAEDIINHPLLIGQQDKKLQRTKQKVHTLKEELQQQKIENAKLQTELELLKNNENTRLTKLEETLKNFHETQKL